MYRVGFLIVRTLGVRLSENFTVKQGESLRLTRAKITARQKKEMVDNVPRGIKFESYSGITVH